MEVKNKKMTSKYVIGCSANNNYAPHLGVMLYSLLKNCSKPTNVIVYIMDGGISKENKEKFLNLEKRFKTKINFLNPNKKKFEKLEFGRHFGIEAYYRLDLVNQVKEKKLLYLDCDLIVEGDIINLFKEKIEKEIALAVEDQGVSNLNKKAIGLNEKEPYFNSGLMLIDGYKWRKKNISEKIIEYILKNPKSIEYADQDELNKILQNKWRKLSPSWNYIVRSLPIVSIVLKKPNVKEIKIIHYAGIVKPWFLLDRHPLRGRYWYYAKQTEWFTEIKKKTRDPVKAIRRVLDYKNFIIFKIKKYLELKSAITP